ncbi:MAG: hypothetical protein ACHQ1G_13925 [Planctomycetota bacterium]
MRAGHRVALLVGLAVLLGSHATRVSAPLHSERAAETGLSSAPAAAEPASAADLTPAGEARPAAYEILGPEVSPDGKSWCILNVALKGPVPKSTLRSLWVALREQQCTEWSRFTCRFYLPDMSPFGDSWADVNEIMIFGGGAPTSSAAEIEADVEEEQAVIVERGEDYLIIEHGGIEIKTPWPSSRAERDLRWVWLPDPLTGDEKRVRVVNPPDASDWLRPRRCASASFR